MSTQVIPETPSNIEINVGLPPLPPPPAQPSYTAIIEHWVKARIDGPTEAIAKSDEAAKQLITVGGFLQGGLIAVYSILEKQQTASMSGWQEAGLILFGLSLLGFLSLAAWVCSIQPETKVNPISNLLEKALNGTIAKCDLQKEVEEWCIEFQTSLEKKLNGLILAKVLFIVCSLTAYLLLLSLLKRS
jgi:hypothetical protein